MLANATANPLILGLTSDDWTVVAAIAQALAAIGAIALLIVTWASQRDSRIALDNSQQLADQTGTLARAAWAQLEASTRPVIQVTYEPHEQRLRLTNKGNGPLLAPTVTLGGKPLTLVSADQKSSSYVQTAAFAVAEDAFALMEASSLPTDTVTISGLTVGGASFSAELNGADFSQRAALVARASSLESPSN